MLNNGQIVVARRAYPLIADDGELGVVVTAPASMQGQQGAMVLITTRGYIVVEKVDVEPSTRSLEGASFEACNAARVDGTLHQALIDGKLNAKQKLTAVAKVFMEAHGGDRDRLEWAEIIDGKVLCDRVLALQRLVQERELSEARVRLEPDAWGPVGAREELGLCGGDLVVTAELFWLVGHSKSGAERCQTCAQEISYLSSELNAVSGVECIYLAHNPEGLADRVEEYAELAKLK